MVQVSDKKHGLGVKDRMLSDRQRAILRFVQEYMQQHGHPPAIRDIGCGVGISSNSTVFYHIKRLIERGYMVKQPGGNRTLVVLDTGLREIGEPSVHNLQTELAALRLENRRLREWCRQLERERAWEREQHQAARAG